MEISEVNPDGNVYQLKDASARAAIAQIKTQNAYSTEETDTGKTWINGKKVYRQCFHSDTNWANGTIIATIQNIEAVIEVRSLARVSDGSYTQNYDGVSNYENQASVNISTGAVKVFRGAQYANSYPSSVIVEYTKTTD